MIVRMLVIVALLVRIIPGPSMLLMTGLDDVGAFPICVSGDDEATPADLPAGGSGRSVHDCLLCPVCQTVSPDAGLGATAIALPAASVWRHAPNARPPAIGPPAPRQEIARPRGPPV